MLSCLYNGKPFNNNQENYSEDDIRKLGKNKQLLCPFCGGAVYYCGKGKRINHFAHYENSCQEKIYSLKRYDTSNKKHDEALEIVYEWIKNQFPNLPIYKEYYIPEYNLYTDLYFTLGDNKIAIEVQFMHKNFDELNAKRNEYKKLGIKDIWIFIIDGIPNPGSPYERHYYRSNNRELYYLNTTDKIFTYYKGLKNEKFDKVRTPLKKYISYECFFDDIKLNNNGEIILPFWREKYIELINQLRKDLHNKIRESKYFKEFVQEIDGIIIEPDKNLHDVIDNMHSSSNIQNANNTIEQKKTYKIASQQSLKYKNYIIAKEKDGFEYLHVVIEYLGQTFPKKYKIIQNINYKNDFILTCLDDKNKFEIHINPILSDRNEMKITKFIEATG